MLYLETLFPFIIVFFCFFGKYRIFTNLGIRADFLWIFVFVILILLMIFLRIKQKKFSVNIFVMIYFVYILFQTIRNIGIESLFAGISFLISLCMYPMLCNINHFPKTKKLLCIFSSYMTISIIFQWLFPNPASYITRFLLSDRTYELNWGGYNNFQNYMSGFAITINIAAYYICVLCALLFSSLIIEKRNRLIAGLLLSVAILALLLTQKRTLFISVFIAIFFVVAFGKKKLSNKIRVFMISSLFLVIGLWLIIEYVPAFNTFVSRMKDIDVLAGRRDFYEEMILWFKQNPVFGVGIGTADRKWSYGGHNCYLQLLGETGIVGFVLFFVVFIAPIKKIWKMICLIWNDSGLLVKYKNELKDLIFSFIMIMITLIYAFTGNPFFDNMFFFLYITFVSVNSEVNMLSMKSNN